MAQPMKRKNRSTITSTTAAFVILVAACGPTTPTQVPTTTEPPEATDTRTTTETPATEETHEIFEVPTETHAEDPGWCNPLSSNAPIGVATFETDSEGVYWAGQVIVTGGAADIDDVVNGLELDLVDEVTAPQVSELIGQVRTDGKLNQAVIRLYAFGTNTPPYVTVASAIHQILNSAQNARVGVFADPNYVIYSPIEALPHSISGSPMGATSMTEAVDGFWSQWALGSSPGIGPVRGPEEPTGEGTEITLFDTSPLVLEGLWRVSRGTHEVGVCVSLPQSSYLNDRFGPYVEGQPHSISGSPVDEVGAGIEHGLFVAGLANAVASASKIHLIRVLDDRAQGDMFTLIKALSLFLKQADVNSLELGPVVNLSLGLRLDAEIHSNALCPHTDECGQIIGSLRDLIGTYLPEYQSYADQDEVPLVALWIPLAAAGDQGSVIAAAAGNDSNAGGQYSARYPAHWGIGDAAMGNIIAVGASNIEGIPSCYSNEAKVLAPGADGTWPDCEGATDQCTDPLCPYGVISLLSSASSPDTGYGYWAGTSFSTPLVSGLTSLVLEKYLSTLSCPSLGAQDVATMIATINPTSQVLSIPGTLAGISKCP